MNRTEELCAKISELESTKCRMISEMKTKPSEDDKPKSGGGGSVSWSRSGTSFGGRAEKKFYGRTELDSHANTNAAGRNCVPIWHT